MTHILILTLYPLDNKAKMYYISISRVV